MVPYLATYLPCLTADLLHNQVVHAQAMPDEVQKLVRLPNQALSIQCLYVPAEANPRKFIDGLARLVLSIEETEIGTSRQLCAQAGAGRDDIVDKETG